MPKDDVSEVEKQSCRTEIVVVANQWLINSIFVSVTKIDRTKLRSHTYF